jgi:hypothetical protein
MRTQGEHNHLSDQYELAQNPDVVYSLFYQDGLTHCLERMLALRSTGNYSDACRVVAMADTYDRLRKARLKSRCYHDVAYIDGFRNGLLFILGERDQDEIPLYYVFGARQQPMCFDEYRRLRRTADNLHKTAYRFAERLVAGYSPGLIAHHTPFLL